jgi:DNA-binding GntR family transcriptional regulator
LRLRRWVQDLPWSLALTWVPASLLYPDFDFGPDTSLYGRLLERHGLRMLRGDRVFTAAPADDADAEHLDVPVGAALLVLSGRNVDQHGRRIAQVAHRIRGDRAEYAVDLQAPAP